VPTPGLALSGPVLRAAPMHTMSYSTFREHLAEYMDRVADDRTKLRVPGSGFAFDGAIQDPVQ
jgi:hypothetical protein